MLGRLNRGWLRRWFFEPLEASGRDYGRAVRKHWIPLVGGIVALIGTSQVFEPSLSLPYWAWLLIAFTLLSWVQFHAFHDMRTERNEKVDELRIGSEFRRNLEHTAITLRQRVAARDLIIEWEHELRVTELLYHRLQPPAHPLAVQDVRRKLEAMDHFVRSI
ncbi:MAG: hypothetical protein E6G03_11960 [Actinobacteria bacterium]|nr:MAG: hypothetical protein E6G03_11960 [Actinomycetota bacterium]